MDPGGTVRHVPEGSRYEYVLDGAVVGIADYRMCAGQVVLHHTVTVPERRGQGIAGHLVAGVLDDVRSTGRHVVPTCWFVAKFIDAHSEYHDLLPESSPA
jgi:predicted GNAT family acetyltransferase